MIFLTLFVYFFLITVAVALSVFPACRVRVLVTLRSAVAAAFLPLYLMVKLGSRSFLLCRYSLSRGGIKVRAIFSANPLFFLSAFLMVIAPTAMIFTFRGPAIFAFSDSSVAADRRISALLDGEQLVPPPALPPEVFTTREVEMVRPDVALASRNWALLDQEFTQRLLVVFRLMKERYGYEMVLIEGYRSPERQAELFKQGGQVTQADANMSYHQYGLAADSAFFKDGRLIISERDPWAMRGYELYGEIARQLGLGWGGEWKFKDYGHVELRKKGVLGVLKSSPK